MNGKNWLELEKVSRGMNGRYGKWRMMATTILMLLNLSLYGEVKYASDFGFTTRNDGAANSAALQRALDGGGEIVVDGAGVYDVSNTCFIDSNTTLRFEQGVVLNKCEAPDKSLMAYMFINRHAHQRIYDENIRLEGLHIKMNGLDNGWDVERVHGLIGTVSFFYVRNLEIVDFETLDGGKNDFVIQVCTFENLLLDGIHIEGYKDAVHLGRGRNFLIRNGRFRTYDDPIALNACDYRISNPELGWIEDGRVEDCSDLDAESTTGFFCRILAGAWTRWQKGLEFQNSDAVISNGSIYRLKAPMGTLQTSLYEPDHAEGTKVYPDGLEWVWTQRQDVTDHCGVRNVHFKNIRLQKRRKVAFSFHFDTDGYSRSFYPGCTPPVQSGIVLENICQQNSIEHLVMCVTPVDTIKIVNSKIHDMGGVCFFNTAERCVMGNACVVFDGVRFLDDNANVVTNPHQRDVSVLFRNCTKTRRDIEVGVDPHTELLGKDIRLREPEAERGKRCKVYSRDGQLYVDREIVGWVTLCNAHGAAVGRFLLGGKHRCVYGLPDGLYLMIASDD